MYSRTLWRVLLIFLLLTHLFTSKKNFPSSVKTGDASMSVDSPRPPIQKGRGKEEFNAGRGWVRGGGTIAISDIYNATRKRQN